MRPEVRAALSGDIFSRKAANQERSGFHEIKNGPENAVGRDCKRAKTMRKAAKNGVKVGAKGLAKICFDGIKKKKNQKIEEKKRLRNWRARKV